MTVFTHDLPAATNKKLAKKLRRQARDGGQRALFDYDAIRASATAPVPVAEAFDVFDATEDPEAVFAAFVA